MFVQTTAIIGSFALRWHTNLHYVNIVMGVGMHLSTSSRLLAAMLSARCSWCADMVVQVTSMSILSRRAAWFRGRPSRPFSFSSRCRFCSGCCTC
eukprot:3340827-Rhodomonas_salina.1